MTNAERIRQMTDEELADVIMCPFYKHGKKIKPKPRLPDTLN